MAALSPGRFAPLPEDALVTRGLWQYSHYYDPVDTRLTATPASVPARIETAAE